MAIARETFRSSTRSHREPCLRDTAAADFRRSVSNVQSVSPPETWGSLEPRFWSCGDGGFSSRRWWLQQWEAMVHGIRLLCPNTSVPIWVRALMYLKLKIFWSQAVAYFACRRAPIAAALPAAALYASQEMPRPRWWSV